MYRSGSLAILFLLFTLAARAAPPDELYEKLKRLGPRAMDEVVWLARCIYSESDRPHEQRLVAWVVRNRVETGFRGESYRDVVLEPRQFSAFNEPSPRRAYILSLDPYTDNAAWRTALEIALEVYQAPPARRPFPITVRHFYSPISMETPEPPRWARLVEPLEAPGLGVDPERFLFFDGIDETMDPPDDSVAGRIEQKHMRKRINVSSLRSRLRSRLSGRVKRPARPIVRRRQ